MFNFESSPQGAIYQQRNRRLLNRWPDQPGSTFCGTGALAITALFSGTSGAATRGDVLIFLPGAGHRRRSTGKTITVRVAADPGCGDTDLNLSSW